MPEDEVAPIMPSRFRHVVAMLVSFLFLCLGLWILWITVHEADTRTLDDVWTLLYTRGRIGLVLTGFGAFCVLGGWFGLGRLDHLSIRIEDDLLVFPETGHRAPLDELGAIRERTNLAGRFVEVVLTNGTTFLLNPQIYGTNTAVVEDLHKMVAAARPELEIAGCPGQNDEPKTIRRSLQRLGFTGPVAFVAVLVGSCLFCVLLGALFKNDPGARRVSQRRQKKAVKTARRSAAADPLVVARRIPREPPRMRVKLFKILSETILADRDGELACEELSRLVAGEEPIATEALESIEGVFRDKGFRTSGAALAFTGQLVEAFSKTPNPTMAKAVMAGFDAAGDAASESAQKLRWAELARIALAEPQSEMLDKAKLTAIAGN